MCLVSLLIAVMQCAHIYFLRLIFIFVHISTSSLSFSSLFVVNNFTSLFTSSSTLLLFFLASFSRPDYSWMSLSHIPLQESASVCRACKFHCRSHFIRIVSLGFNAMLTV